MGISITKAPPSGLVEASPVWAPIALPYQLFDVLPEHVEEALRASIERFGVIVPIVRDQHGTIIDGHHRARIAADLGVDYPEDTVTVSGEDEAREIARHLNTRRRHLSGEQLREHIVMLAQRTTTAGIGKLSQREIAQVAGVAPSYVNKVLKDGQLLTSEQLPEQRIGADGKVRPAHREAAPASVERTPTPALFSDADEWVEPDEPEHLLDMVPMETIAPTATIAPAAAREAEETREAQRRGAEKIVNSPEMQLSQVLVNYSAAVVRLRDFTTLDPDRVAEAINSRGNWAERWDDLDRLRATVDAWFERIDSARPRPGLRLAGGDQ